MKGLLRANGYEISEYPCLSSFLKEVPDQCTRVWWNHF